MAIANGIKQVGKVITYFGVGCAALMLVVGTVAIDIVIFAAMLKASENRRNRDSQYNSFVTGMLFGMMFSGNNSRGIYSSAGWALALSPITTVIAIALSFFLGVPAVGVGLALGWLGVAAVVGLGILTYGAGQLLETYNQRITQRDADTPLNGIPKDHNSWSACRTSSTSSAPKSFAQSQTEEEPVKRTNQNMDPSAPPENNVSEYPGSFYYCVDFRNSPPPTYQESIGLSNPL